ncbi:MAG: class I tRNA ligase family protein [Actinomycetes bacterium]|jgi:L-cysteine:1D-myo-inositol 2-amino-2-deoxy-alpha-D-glucopyranoside ligase
MNSWPRVFTPTVSVSKFPILSIKTAQGSRTFEPGDPIKMYVCGITPYDATHMGHAATYLTFDLINRYLTASGSEISFVENITDIDEPLLERALRDDQDWKQLAADQIALYETDMTALRILPPKYFIPATGVMDLVSQAITRMKENGFVYTVDQDLYFDVSSFLPQLPISLEQALAVFSSRGGDPDRVGKRHPLDPVLWIANRNNEPGWESVHGFGRPGWHIECCVISLRYLNGEDFMNATTGDFLIDIQGGGSDLIFPHHFMSSAQAQAMTGQPFSYSFIHTGMVGLDGEKMSKSKGNLVFVSRLLQSNVDSMVIRMALLSSHYATDRMWSSGLLDTATQLVDSLRSCLSREEVAPTTLLIQEIVCALANDINTPQVLSLLSAWTQATESGDIGGSAGELARALDALLGLAL